MEQGQGQLPQPPEHTAIYDERAAAMARMASSEATADDLEYDRSDPYERVEDFLIDVHAGYMDSRQEWQKLQRVQQELLSIPNDPIAAMYSYFPRHERRKKAMQKAMGGGMVSVITFHRKEAERDFEESVIPDIDLKVSDVDNFLAMPDELREGNRKMMDIDPSEERKDMYRKFNETYEHMVRARFLDEMNARRLKKFLRDPEVVRPFIERLKSLAATPNQDEFPGLLESLSISMRKDGSRDVILTALRQSTPDASTYAQDFFKEYFTENTSNSQKLQQHVKAAIDMTRLLCDVTTPEGSSDLLQRLVAAQDKWPDWLQAEIKTYAKTRLNKEQAELMHDLMPFFHESRASGMSIGTSVSGKRTARTLPEKTAQTVQPADTAPEEYKPKPITQFAALRLSGGNARNASLRLTEVGDIDALMESEGIASYLQKHQQEQSLTQNIRQALELLAKDPFNKTSTRQYVGCAYDLHDGSQRPHMRRLSFQACPWVEGGGVITRKTRILYSVVRQNGQNCLAVYGAFIKQELESIDRGALPVR